MQSQEIRTRFLKFFEKRGHKIIPSASLITSDEKGVTNSTLFNTAGMQPLIPYLLGQTHPLGKRLVDSQKCVRTVDIDDIGDKTHATFFEMLGNWSLGDYFKSEAINWSYQFLTSKEEGLGFNPENLYVTVFEGDENAPKDEEAAEIWREIFKKAGIEGERIFYMPAKNNWWEAGDNGPCGPDSEMYYDVKNKFGGKGITKEQFIQADEARDVVEVWNDVFMQYEKKDGKIIGKLKANNVDTGAGLERLCMVSQGVDNIYETDLFSKIIEIFRTSPNVKIKDERAFRIIADHLRTSFFLIDEGVLPSNEGRGYVLRRIIRRMVRYMDEVLNLEKGTLSSLGSAVVEPYISIYPEIAINSGNISNVIKEEEQKFRKTLKNGLKSFNMFGADSISGEVAFILYSTHGFPIELTEELAKERGLNVDRLRFDYLMKQHQDLSRVGAEQKFKGGLSGTGEMETKYHTATHLLLASLKEVLKADIVQKGSNITAERMRFDFNWPEKLLTEKLNEVENLVNQKITEAIPVEMKEMPKEEAKKVVTTLAFDLSKYGDIVKVYKIGNLSAELCGGPHVKNTKELGHFKIVKEEAVSAGVRRIKAILE